jgi:hypothetical protein
MANKELEWPYMEKAGKKEGEREEVRTSLLTARFPLRGRGTPP